MAQLRIGTCSWKYPSWSGLVYSAPKGINYLQEYTRRYNAVEVDQWFWSLFKAGDPKLPEPSDVEEYRRSVPDSFRFTVKVPNSLTLTHAYRQTRTDPLTANPYFLSPALFAQFMSLLEPMADVLGPLLFQFEYLSREKMSSQAEFQTRFEHFLAALPPGHQYALETRNPNCLNERYFDFLQRNRLIPVLLQGYWMPDLRHTYRQWRSHLLQHETIVIRLHGPDRKGVEREAGGQWDQIVVPREDELRGIAEIVRDLLEEGVNIYVNVNNHYEGSAPLSIERLLEFMRER